MKDSLFKRSAVHNLRVTKCRTEFSSGEVSEGLLIPKSILDKADILPWEQIIVTKIDGGNWINRLTTFAIAGKEDGVVEARGSLASFLNEGDLTCLITRMTLPDDNLIRFNQNEIPIFDLGFDPESNMDNLIDSRLDIEYGTKKEIDVKESEQLIEKRNSVSRFFLQSLILSLVVNKTHPNCLQGSAELPDKIMREGLVNKYQCVSVYNASKGGIADTYAVPMPAGVVMTTGAMAGFAPIGDKVNIAAYSIYSRPNTFPKIVLTDGKDFQGTITF